MASSSATEPSPAAAAATSTPTSAATIVPPAPAPSAPSLPPLALPQFSAFSDPVSLARIPVLLVPVGEVDKDRWDAWTKKIGKFTEIKLSDVPGTSGSAAKTGKARFLPPSFPPPTTSLHLNFITTPPQKYLLPLSLFRISASPLAVIGISDLSHPDATHANQIEQFETALEEMGLGGASGGIYPLAKRCFGVEEDVEKRKLGDVVGYKVDDDGLSVDPPSRVATPMSQGTPRRVEESAQLEGMVEIDASDEVPIPIPPPLSHTNSHSSAGPEPVSPTEAKKYYDRKGHEEKMVVIPKDGNVDLVLGMLMADLCASILTEFGEIATALESTSGLQTITSSLLPTLTLKPVPKVPSGAGTRPKSTTFCHIAVTNNTAPVGTGIGIAGIGINRTPSPATPITSPSFSTSQPNLLDRESRDSVGPLRNGSPGPKAFTNTPLPDSSKSENRLSTGMGIKRSSTGFGFGSSVSRVISGKGMGGDGSSQSAMMTGMGGQAAPPVPTGSPVGGGSGSGRLRKLLGDLWLLSGRLADALHTYGEASATLKNQNDFLWQASAVEGLATATLLEAWEARDVRDDAVTPFTSSAFLNTIHDHFNNSFALYGRSPRPPDSLFPHGQESGETIIASLYTSCALKLARTMLFSWAAGGFGTASLNCLISGGVPRVYPPMNYRAKWRVFLKLSTMSKIQRNLVSRLASRAHGPFLATLPRPVQLDAFITLVGMNRMLGLERREIYFTREAIGLSLALILEARLLDRAEYAGTFPNGGLTEHVLPEEDFNSGPPTQGIGLSPSKTPQVGEIAVRKKESTEGNVGILNMLSRVLDIMGLSLADDPGKTGEQSALQAYGWPELQVEILREAIYAAESLPDQSSVMRFTAMGLKHLVEYLSPAAQYRLHEIFTEAVQISSRRGIALTNVQWWLPGDLITGMDILPIPPTRIPYEQARAALDTVKTDPFLYNPRAKTANSVQSTVIEGEPFDVAVEVTNPFSFDLDIRGLSLVTSGVPCETRPLRFILPANTVQMVRLGGIAAEAGRLTVDGCRVVLQDGAEKVISVPARRASTPFKRERQRHALDKGLVKSLGLNSRPGKAPHSRASLKASEELCLPCEVVPAQPLLWIRSTSLVHGSVITYHGEQSTIKLVLENTSNLPVNFLKIHFEDNTSVSGREILESGTLPSGHAYQLGKDLFHRPVLSVDEDELSDINIEPGKTFTVIAHCLGKIGCENATIDVDYGFAPSKESSTQDTVYSRRISLPVLFTVHPALECTSLSIMPWPRKTASASIAAISTPPSADSPAENGSAMKPHEHLRHHSSYHQERELAAVFRDELEAGSQDETCLVLLEVFNRSNIALEFALERLENPVQDRDDPVRPGRKSIAHVGAETLVVRRLVPAGSVERVPVPLKRSWLSHEVLKAPIPVLDQRQFIVADKSAEDQRPEYLSDFWYRKHMLSQIRGWWTDPTSSRVGEVVFIHSSVSGMGLMHYKLPDLKVVLNILDGEGASTTALTSDEFATIELQLRRDHGEPAKSRDKAHPLLYRILPKIPNGQVEGPDSRLNGPDGVSRHILFDDPLDGLLEPTEDGQSGVGRVGVTFLTSGSFSFAAVVRDTATGDLWYTEPVTVVVK